MRIIRSIPFLSQSIPHESYYISRRKIATSLPSHHVSILGNPFYYTKKSTADTSNPHRLVQNTQYVEDWWTGDPVQPAEKAADILLPPEEDKESEGDDEGEQSKGKAKGKEKEAQSSEVQDENEDEDVEMGGVIGGVALPIRQAKPEEMQRR